MEDCYKSSQLEELKVESCFRNCRSCSTFVIEYDKNKLIPLQNLTLVAKNIFFKYYVKSINQREMNSGKKIKARKIFKPRS